MGSEASHLERYKAIIAATPEARITRLEIELKGAEDCILELQARIKHLEDLLTPPSSMKTALDHRHSYLYQEDDKPPSPTDT
jgi:hypothetical protein